MSEEILAIKVPARKRRRRRAPTRVSTLKKQLLSSRKKLLKELRGVISDIDTLSGKKGPERSHVTITKTDESV